ncbi:hypothetical protein DITRI_Ditri03aG0070100 [Diplodiscus trichospermus]
MGDKEDFYENRRTDGYQGGSRSPPYEDSYERRYSDRSSPGGRNDDRNFRYGYDERRSPGYDQESRQYGDYRKSPARPEVVNDWRREDRFDNGRKPEDRRISDGDPKLEGRSPERAKDLESSSPPAVRPVREILGENVIPLRISEPPKANGGRTVGNPQTQRTASFSSLGSTSGNPAEVKLETTGSLIDFDADPEPPVAPVVTQTQQTMVTQSVVQPMNSANDNNWASFDFPPQTNVSLAPSNVNTLDSVLSQLSVPASVSGHQSGVSSGVGGQVPAPGLTPGMPVSSGSSQVGVNNAGQWPNMMQQQRQQTYFFSAAGSQSTSQLFVSPVDGASTNQMQGRLGAAVAQSPQAVSKPVQDVATAIALHPPPTETKASRRKELPADLFAATYPIYPAAAAGWQAGPPHGMGYTMQYNTAVPIPAFPQSSRSINPFDLGGEAPQAQTQTFPSMASLQGALPNVPPPSNLVRTPSLGTPSAAWMPPQFLPYASGVPSQSLAYPSAVPQRPYPGVQLPSNLPPSSHQIGGIGIGSEASFAFVNTDQHVAGKFSASATPQPFSSVRGNPFG